MPLTRSDYEHLKEASQYAQIYSGCNKVCVGSVIVQRGMVVSFGANKTDGNNCKKIGCLREQKYGDNSKAHRNPDDCRAVHSEIDAICSSVIPVMGATIFVTRYPCEACARAIVASGITRVVYGREQKISDMTAAIFAQRPHITVDHASDFKEDDVLL